MPLISGDAKEAAEIATGAIIMRAKAHVIGAAIQEHGFWGMLKLAGGNWLDSVKDTGRQLAEGWGKAHHR